MESFEFKYARTSDGVSIAYGVTGQGPAIILIGDILFAEVASPIWEVPEIRNFLDDVYGGGYRVVIYDPRGSGSSDRDVSDLSLNGFLLDIETVAAAEGLDRFGLGCTGMGGPIGAAFAAVHPDRVLALALHDAWIRGRDFIDPVRAKGVLQLAELDPDTFAQTIGRMLQGWQDGSVTGPFIAAIKRAAGDRAAFARLVAALSALDASSLLPEVRAPTLVLWERGGSVLYRDGVAREIAAAIPRAKLVVTEPDEHGLPDAIFRQRLRQFLNEHLPIEQATLQRTSAAAFRTILFTDLEGHTAMMSRLGDAGGREVLREHERLTRDALVAHGGTEVKTLGDGFLASFGSAQKAVECAVELQRMVAESPVLSAQQLRIRVGVNAGEPIAEDDDLFGASVIAAARIAARAEGGQVLVANVVRELVAGKGFLFHDTGEHDLKGLEDPVRLWELRWERA